jgi:hypothetical protein
MCIDTQNVYTRNDKTCKVELTDLKTWGIVS